MNIQPRTILLVQPPIRDFYFTKKRSIPYGLACIAAALEKKGFRVVILDALATSRSRVLEIPAEMDYLSEFYGQKDLSPFSLFHGFRHYGSSYEHIGNKARESGAFLVGISSLFTAYAGEALEVARVVKKQHPSCRVVMGGHHPTHMPGEVLNEQAVDYVIRGEGEQPMVELALALSGGLPMDGIKGLAYRNFEGGLVISPPVYMDNPDDYPLPSLELVDQDFYGRRNGRSTVITASRGCPMTCSYCCVASSASCYRKRSVDKVFEEIEKAVTVHGARFIDFEDENLTLDKSWCFDLLNRICLTFGDLGLELRAMNGLYPPSLDDELVRKMSEAGFKTLNLSLCTLSKDQLKRFRRPDVKQAYEAALDSAVRWGMDSVTYVLVGAPGQDAFESLADLVYLAGLNTLGGVSVYYPAPGSRDFDTMKQKNTLPLSLSLMRSTAVPVSDTTTRLESVTLLRLGRIVNYCKDLKRNAVNIKPRGLGADEILDPSDRSASGLRLLEAFFHDGRVRGMDQDGKVYEHRVSDPLIQRFISDAAGMILPSPTDPPGHGSRL